MLRTNPLRIALFFLLFCVVFSSGYSQTSTDSLRSIWQNETEVDSVRFNALKEYHYINNHSQPDSALIALDYYYELANEKKATRHMFRALNRQANIHRLKGNFDKAEKLYNKAGDLAVQLENRVLQATITGNIGNIYLKQQAYQEATQYYAKALKVFQEEKDEKGEGRMLLSLGSVYSTIGDYELAVEYYEKSLPVYEKRNTKDTGVAIIFMNIGWMHFQQELHEDAISDFEKALKILEIKDEKFYIAGCYSSLAQIYQDLNQLDLAYENAEKSLVISREVKVESGIVEALLIIAQITFETNIDEATRQGEAVLARLTPQLSSEVKKETYELLYRCYKAQNKLDLSLQMHERFTIYSDSTLLEKNNFAVAREVVKNDFELKLYESKLENEKTQAALKLDHTHKTYGIVFGALALISLLLFYFRKQSLDNRKKREELLVELEHLKEVGASTIAVGANKFELNKKNIEASLDRKLNETDWKVLNILLEDPVIPNKEIAEKAFLSVDGIGSSLRRMYEYFEVKESKYKKISLLLDAIKHSNKAA